MTQEKPLVVALDFDDVCIDFNSAFAAYNRIYHGTSYTREDVNDFNLSLILKCSHEEMLMRAREFVNSKLHDSVVPVEGAVEAITWLHKEGVSMPIITARDEVIRIPTFSLIEKHFSGKLKDVHFLHRNDENVLGEKGEVCARLEADFLIEDALHNALHPSCNNTQVLLLDTPWNKIDSLPKHVTRVFGWEHVLEIIRGR